MPDIEKAYEITDARISFVSLVDKAANKKSFIITKAEDGQASFNSGGRIIKTDVEQHWVTGIVYEPMTEDTQGNFMTAEEITKAAHWFAKNGNQVDIQHCFVKAEGADVVESYVSMCDMDINDNIIKKGTWLMTVEVTNDDIWNAIEKGEITGFSMGGVGTYSDEDKDLSVTKGAVKNRYNRNIKSDNFYTAWSALRGVLEAEHYNSETGNWEYGLTDDEQKIREALEDFNEIVTNLLTAETGIIKSLEKAASEAPDTVTKAGKCLSNKNLNAIKGIRDMFDSFIAEFDDTDADDNNNENSDNPDNEDESKDNNNIKKEDEVMKTEEVKSMIDEAVTKAMQDITTQLDAIAKTDDESAVIKEDNSSSEDVTPESVAKMVNEAVSKAIEPVTKSLESIMKSRALPGNLNDVAGTVEKSNVEPHYMTGIF